MPQHLPPEDLGHVGESLFRTLCAQARLVCNKSDRDVTGWDFIVEFPMVSPDAGIPLDQRPTKACHVQLKSTAGKNGSRVSAKLSAVERLAKDPRPALIIAFRLRSDGKPVAGYVIHLAGERLSRILYRLRQAEASRSFDINHVTISFDYRKDGVRFDLSPDGLKTALETMIGDDPAGYVQEKQRQLAELGYEEGVLEGEALIWIEGPEHLNDIVLGLASVRPERLDLFDRRFGIRVPYRGELVDSIEEIRLDLPYLCDCDVIVMGNTFARAATFKAEMLIPPPMAGGPWLLIRHQDFTLTFKQEGGEFETSGCDGLNTLDAWSTLIRALSNLASGAARLSIGWMAPDARSLSLSVDQQLDGPNLDRLPAMTKFLDGWQRLLEIAGMRSVEYFALNAIWDAYAAQMAVAMLLDPTPSPPSSSTTSKVLRQNRLKQSTSIPAPSPAR